MDSSKALSPLGKNTRIISGNYLREAEGLSFISNKRITIETPINMINGFNVIGCLFETLDNMQVTK